MLHSLRVYSLCLLLSVAVLSVGCATRPSVLPTHTWEKPCDTCTCMMEHYDMCIKGVKNFAKVSSPALWRGAQPDPKQDGFRNLENAGVKTIVNLRYDHDDLPFLAGTKLRYFWIKARAWHPEEEDLIKFLKVLEDKENWPVFVHCAAGKDRTGYAVATYRIVEENWPADDAIHEMFDFGYNPWWFRNPGFLRDKIEEERECIVKKVERACPPRPVKVEGMRLK
jgi:protein tyrosine phosphatase (PTP) superfamily phosphohydrolase (DUF442 family)